MAAMSITSTEAQRLREPEGAKVEKAKDFFTSSLKWSLALLGVQNLLLTMQVTFITIAVALIGLFIISSRTTQSDWRKTFINFAFFILGCLVVGITLNSIVLNSYIKWVLYGLFLVMVATNPNCRQIYQEMKPIFKPMCETISSRLKNLFIKSKGIIKDLWNSSDADRGGSSMNSNDVTQTINGDGGRVEENNV